MISIPFDNLKRLRNRIQRDGLPREITAIKADIAKAQANAEALYVLFGRQIDYGSCEVVAKLRMELDDAYGRAALAE